ncbi:mercuric reductase [Mucilaginibacter sp. SP1R1]|uniref:mercuric reductase n=1 Tax=Mucilaginibacter sp. SP1R1 TaxID=2723091 RepID=UPI0016107D64|nr:mercuric reductase [Mucilaginibacter sp. SP1R1]MBB6150470.1 pyruvate/2-oxoglutarate dehydrogenase complex dihydrolipoamide dehydrogenase (E3) component [Mucilaginibacter sp. SP1R1]
MKKYDVIIIGAGQAGAPLAKKLANAGKKTVIIEKRFYGGTCVNDGCTPTKTWVASAKAAYMAGKSTELGVPVKRFSINMSQIKKRKDDIVLRSRNGGLHAAEKTKNLDVIFGEAIFTGDKTLQVNLNSGKKQTLQADLIFLNTGASPLIPQIDGLNDIKYLTSTTILDLDYVPEHLLILGGNYIGLEFGQMFRRFGSKVTILEKSARIVSHEDEDISAEMQNILEAEKITIHNNAHATKFKQKAGGKITVTVSAGDKESKIKCSHVLVAVGRTPQTEALQLQKTGVVTDETGHIKVNNKLETNIPGIYALGDVKGGPAFTHISYNDYTIVYRNIIEKQNLNINDRPVPYCMFTDPQLGRVGIDETEAKKLGLNYRVAKLPMAHVARAIETGDTRGFMKAIVDVKTKKILGAAVLGPEGGEIMTVLQMAMEGGITYDRIRYCVFAHPLYSESLNNLFMTLED